MKKVILKIMGMMIVGVVSAQAMQPNVIGSMSLISGTTTILGQDVQSYGIGIEKTKMNSKGFLIGATGFIEQSSIDNNETGNLESIVGFGGGIKIGYAPDEKINIYTSIDVKTQIFDEGGAGGFGTSYGIEFRALKGLAVSIDKTSFDMKRSTTSEKFINKATSVSIKYTW